MNKCVICGRFTADPESRFTQAGKQVTDFTIAVDDGFGDNKKTTFINCTAWDKKAELIQNSMTKGKKLLVVGRWCQQSWETQDGQKRRKDFLTVEEIEFVEPKQQSEQKSGFDMKSFGTEVFPEEEIPF